MVSFKGPCFLWPEKDEPPERVALLTAVSVVEVAPLAIAGPF
jgi:hypothetical protein